MIEEFVVGQGLTFTAKFFDADGTTPLDPSGISFKIKPPGASVVSFVLADFTHPSTGVYTKAYTVDVPGQWYAKVDGTGAKPSADQITFNVKESAFD